jgi:sulfur relay (sulfurtransferase) DsrC/TusE family protein
MKTRLNITIDDHLLSNMKAYATRQQTSISKLVEGYFESITRHPKRKNIINLVEKLKSPQIDNSADLKKLFYKDQAKKYGF